MIVEKQYHVPANHPKCSQAGQCPMNIKPKTSFRKGFFLSCKRSKKAVGRGFNSSSGAIRFFLASLGLTLFLHGCEIWDNTEKKVVIVVGEKKLTIDEHR